LEQVVVLVFEVLIEKTAASSQMPDKFIKICISRRYSDQGNGWTGYVLIEYGNQK
jgi:hypothetical protein